ncbi:MAG: phospho-N-acetylmuramoyl-pentapeptide-transferase [Patescibacteria group bacterium]
MKTISPEMISQLLKIGLLSGGAFIFAMLMTPLYTHFAYKKHWWKKMKTEAIDGGELTVFNKLHKEKHKRNIPTMAGVLIWGTVLILTLLFNLDRAQTWLPLFTITSVGILGIVDDVVNVRSSGGLAGMKSKIKMLWLILIALVGALWFYYKLGYNMVEVPFVGDINIGWLYILLFILVFISSANAVNITDGLDGLSGGLLATAFFAFLVIAFFQGNYGIAAFCGTLVGAILAYTWFNIYPARFFMGDTGAVSLGATLGVVAMLTNSVLVLPVIGFIFVIETLSVIIQLSSRKIRNQKVFLAAPIHHHFEAKGWPETKVTMRFWVIGMIMAVSGVVLKFIYG